jgi:uncharacterized protein involved in propanediol utilization
MVSILHATFKFVRRLIKIILMKKRIIQIEARLGYFTDDSRLFTYTSCHLLTFSGEKMALFSAAILCC